MVAQLQHGHVPLLDIWVHPCLIILQVKGSNYANTNITWNSLLFIMTVPKKVWLGRINSLLAKISTGDPSGRSHGQPLNCQAGPWTKTATTRSLWTINSFKCTFNKLYLKHYSHFSITIIYAWQIIWLVLVLTISTACRPSLPQPMKVYVCDLIRLPVLWGQFKWLVDHSVRNGDADCGSAWLHLIFPSLQKNLIVSLNALFLLFFWRDKPANQQVN